MTGVRLHMKVFWMAFLLYALKPQVSINGSAPFAVSWGDNDIPLQPGRYEIQCWYNYLFGPANRARITVDVAAGAVVQLRYRTRWAVFLPGKLEVTSTTASGPPTNTWAPPTPQPPR